MEIAASVSESCHDYLEPEGKFPGVSGTPMVLFAISHGMKTWHVAKSIDLR